MLDQIDNHLPSSWHSFLPDAALKPSASRKRQRQSPSPSSPSTTSTLERRNSKVTKVEYKKGLWDKEEDVKLLQLVKEQQREGDPSDVKSRKLNWTIVSKGMKTRSCKQCRERWVNHLNPGVRKTKWTAEEDKLLLELARENPRKWAQIARQMPGRTENMVKIRWNSLNKQANSSKASRAGERRNSVKFDPRSVHKQALEAQTSPNSDHRQSRSLPQRRSQSGEQAQGNVNVNMSSKYDSLPFIRSSIADYCGHSPEYSKAEPFIEDVFLDDYVLDSFMFDDAQPYAGSRSNNALMFDNLVPINL